MAVKPGLIAATLAAGVVACSQAPEPPPAAAVPQATPAAAARATDAAGPTAPAPRDAGIAWHKGDVDAAFALA